MAQPPRHPPHADDHRADAQARRAAPRRCGLRAATAPRPAAAAPRPPPSHSGQRWPRCTGGVRPAATAGPARWAASTATASTRGHARPRPVTPRSVAKAATPSTNSTTSDFRLPPPTRTSVLLPQPEASTMPKPNISPPTSVRQPQQRGPGIDAVGGLDPAQRHHGVEADHRHADGQHPHAHARPVADVDDVGHRAHGAEVGALRDGAEGHGQREGGPQHRAAEAGSRFLHAAILCSAACAVARVLRTRCRRGLLQRRQRSLPACAASDFG